jgi:AcrR family transcriptional regulator
MSGKKVPSRRGRPRTTDPDRILDVAMEAYWSQDPADVSVNTICRLAGVSKPSLYRDFGSEDGLTRATLEHYAKRVLVDVFAILEAGDGLHSTLDALIDFASDDPRMETGCLFYKMRSGKHRLGPQTRALVDDIDAAARAAYAGFLRACRASGEWAGGPTDEAGGRYLSEQVGLAITQRASGEDSAQVRDALSLALSVFRGAVRQ